MFAPALLFAASEPAPTLNSLQVSELSFSFELFDPTQPVEHTYYLYNQGSDLIRVERIALTPPLQVKKIVSKIPPGEAGQLVVSLGTPRELGEYRGAIEVTFKNRDLSPLPLEFIGKITPVIEVRPLPAFFVVTARGRTNSASLEIINKDTEPLQITNIQCANTNCELKLTALEPGVRYRLQLAVRPDARPGRQKENITLLTSSTKQPRVLIEANTLVRERVYAFPETVDLGRIKISELKSNPALTNLVNQDLMVYQDNGQNFEATPTIDLDCLQLASERSPLRDRYEIRVQVAVEKLVPARLKGTIRIDTNDPDFPTLKVPVQCIVE